MNIFNPSVVAFALGAKQRIKCLAQGHNTVPSVRCEPATT